MINFFYKLFLTSNTIVDIFSLHRLLSYVKILFYFILKRDTKYPSYLINYENKISILNKKKYTLSFSSGTQAFESLIKALDIKNKKIGTSNIVFPSIFGILTRYILSENLKILTCNKNLQLDLDKNYEEIKELDYLLITFSFGYPYNNELIDKIFSINRDIILIYDLSHCQGYSSDNFHNQMKIHFFFSTQGSKAISTGEGGIVSTDDKNIYKRMMINSHINRLDKKLNFTEKENLALKVGLLSKSRMSPIGAVSGLNDIYYLKKKNKILRNKTHILYEELSNINKISFPKISNLENLSGFNYGIPFIINSELKENQKKDVISQVKKYFIVRKYNWLTTDNLKKLKDVENFKKFHNYNFDFLSINGDEEDDKIISNIYFIDLNYIKTLPNFIIKIFAKKTKFLIK